MKVQLQTAAMLVLAVALIAALVFVPHGGDKPALQAPLPANTTPMPVPDPDPPVADEGLSAPQAKSAAPPGGRPGNVPKAFRGEWNAVIADCGSGNHSSLRITATTLQFSEETGTVTSIDQPGPREIAVIMMLKGANWQTEDHRSFTLSRDGQALLEVTHKYTRFRCPSGR